MITLNIWPIIVAAVVSFGIGSLWYSPILFGHEWIKLMKMSDTDIAAAQAQGLWKHYVSQFIAALISFAVLAFFVSAIGAQTPGDGAFLGFLVWLGFTATEAVGTMLWEKKPFKLVLIQTIGTLVNLAIGGAIIGAWR